MTDTDPAPAATPPAPAAPDTPAPVDPTAELEALKAKYERAQADLAKFRTRADEVTAANKAAEEKALAEADAVKKAELLQAKVTELEKASADAAARAIAAERRATLTGHVADATAALRLLDESKHLTEDGTVNTAALLADYPFLKPTTSGNQATPGAGGTLPTRQAKVAALQEQLAAAKTMTERVALTRQIHEAQKG